MPKSDWMPTISTWGEPAFQETVQALDGRTASRGVALCAWCYAQDPSCADDLIEALAQRDHDFPASTATGKKITAQSRRRARELLGLAAPAKKRTAARKTKTRKQPKRSAIEKAVLARFQESMLVVSEYARYAEELTAALEAFESARDALHDIPAEHVQTLADADPDAMAILSREGLLGAPDSNMESSAEWSPEPLESAPVDRESNGFDSDQTDAWSSR